MSAKHAGAVIGVLVLAFLGLSAGEKAVEAQDPVPAGYRHYVGALHEHSGYSDGWPGSRPADYYASAKSYGLDFLGSSEHSDNSDLPVVLSEQCFDPGSTANCVVADQANPEDSLRKWRATEEQARAATDADFTGFRGFEWTNNRHGHINVYFSRNNTNAVVDGSQATLEKFWNWFTTGPEASGGSDGLGTFNHPGDKGIRPEDPAFNWNGFEYVPEADERMVGLEVFNGDKDYAVREDRSGACGGRSMRGGYYACALDKGWHVGAVGAEDVHDAEGWGAPRWSKTVLISRDRSAPALREAMLNRRMYAVLDNDVRMEMTAAGEPMGSRVARPEGSEVPIRASVTPEAGRLELVSNGGEVVAGADGSKIDYEATVTGEERYYFLRVLDASGEPIAYSSPVWVRAGGPPAPRGEWVAGDLHVHTPYSHDSYGGPNDDNTGADEAYLLGASVQENFENASKWGLDYLAITDHNDVRSQKDPGFGAAGVIPIPGYENSLQGHAQMLGARRDEPYDNGDQSAAAVSSLADALRGDGGVFQVNHPYYKAESFPDDIDWKYRYQVVPDTVEVWNQASSGTNAYAVRYWEGWLDEGEKIGATGGSDSHYKATSAALLGSPTTWVFVTERSERGILEGLQAGRTFLSAQPPGAEGARILLEADADADGSYEAMVGDTAPQGSALRARVVGAPGSSLRIVTDSGEDAFDPVPVTSADFEHRFTLPEEVTWARAEAFDPGVEEALEASCEAPAGFDGTLCAGVLPARAMTSALYLEAPNTAPTITPVSPAPGSTTRDRTPTIAATVRDAETDLARSDIRLFVDGKRVTAFSYNRATGRLIHKSKRLSPGGHTVEVRATDEQGLTGTGTWSFTVARQRER